MDRVQRIAIALKANLYPEGKRLQGLSSKFESLCNGNEFISLEQYEKQMKEEIETGERYKNLKDDVKAMIIKRRVNMIKKRDTNNDGKVSKSEYLNAEFYSSLDAVLSGAGDGYDGIMDETEILKFLQNWCVNEKDVKALSDTFRQEITPADHGIETKDVIDGLYSLVCPPVHVMMGRLVKKVRELFSVCEDEKHELNAAFDMLTGGKDSITLVQYGKILRQRLKVLNFGDESKKILKKLVKERIHAFHDMDRNKDGKVSRNEFISHVSYVKLISSMVGYDKNGDMIADRPELIAWVSEQLGLTIDTENYVDALSNEIMGKDGTKVKGRALVTGLFDRAFPSDAARVKQVVEAVHQKFTLTDERTKALAAEFKDVSGGKEFIDMETYEQVARKQLEDEYKDCGMPKSMVKSLIEDTMPSKMDTMRNMDRSKDGKITQTEYMLSRVYDDLLNSLMGKNAADGGDSKVDKVEMSNWLEGCLGIKDDLEQVTLAVIDGMKDAGEGGELDTWNFADRLYAAAFPPDDILIRRVIEAIRTNFAFSAEERKKLSNKFSKLAGKCDTISKDDAKKQAAADIKELYKPEMVKVLLEKRLDGIDKSDVNNDGKITMEEWFRSQLFEKIFFSLHAADADGNLILDRSEFITWLAEKCLLIGEMYADAIMAAFLGHHEDVLKINDLMEPLFDRVCPTPAMRMKIVGEGLVKNFGGKEADMRASLQKSAEKTADDGCTVEELIHWLETDAGMPEEAEENAKGVFSIVCPNGERTVKAAAIIDTIIDKIVEAQR